MLLHKKEQHAWKAAGIEMRNPITITTLIITVTTLILTKLQALVLAKLCKNNQMTL